MPREKLSRDEYIIAQVDRAKKPSEIYVDFSAWILEKTGVKITPTHLQIGGRLYMEFQKENRENGTGRSRGAVTHASPKPVPAPRKKPTTKPVSDEAAAADAEVATPNKKVPAKRGAPAKQPKPVVKPAADVKPVPAKPRSGRRGKPVADDVEAPY